MRTALRKIGNSAGMILPQALIEKIGSKLGETFDLSVENGRIVAAPVRDVDKHAGWEEAAAAIGAEQDAESEEWLALTTDFDADWKW